MRVADAVADSVRAEGVTSLFGIMGDGNMYFLTRLLEQGETRVYDARHEGSAVAMADGYARATGDVGVATVTSGPGVTQLGTSLTVANRHGSPIVVIAGDVPTSLRGMGSHRQDMDQRAFVQASGALFHQLRGPSTAAADVQHVFWLARTRRQPVVLSCPIDLQNSEFAGETHYIPSRTPIPATPPLTPGAQAVEKAADMLAAARRPVLLAGAGVTTDARPLIDKIADRVGAALVTTLPAKGYLDGAWSVGLCGSLSTVGGEAVLAAADLVVLIGASGSAETAEAIPTTARTIQINTNPLVMVGNRPPDHLVYGGLEGRPRRHCAGSLRMRISARPGSETAPTLSISLSTQSQRT